MRTQYSLSFILTHYICSLQERLRFTTNHTIGKYTDLDLTKPPKAHFDHYFFYAFALAIDPTTNHSVPIATFTVVDIPGDFTVYSHGTAVTTDFTYDSGDGLVTTEVESRVLQVKIKRSVIAKAFAGSLFLINWLLTVSLVYITLRVACKKMEVGIAVAASPLGFLSTIPTIRSLYASSIPLGSSAGKSCVLELPLFRFTF